MNIRSEAGYGRDPSAPLRAGAASALSATLPPWMPSRRTSPRLSQFDYTGAYGYHIVLTNRGRAPRFRAADLVDACLNQLALSSSKYGFSIEAYCFMPDHLHLLIVGSDEAPLTRFVQHFKQATGYGYPGLWQRSYYDRILRHEEDLQSVAMYVWSNPVAAGFVDDAVDYPFSGPRGRLLGLREGLAADRAEALSLQVPPQGSGEK